jgi:tRNA(Arg) A34 adenosine deaminase TadA
MRTAFATAWNALEVGARRSLELAHVTLCAGGLAVGSVIIDAAGTIVAEGRNRAYDPATGTDPLEGTPLAHAEMNALARLATSADPTALTIWSSQQPCSMCAAALAFIGITEVHVIATDPSDPARRAREELDDVWVVLATAMFMVGPLRRGGIVHPTVRQNRTLEPEAVELADRALAAGYPLTDGRPLPDGLPQIWVELVAAAGSRRRRLAASGSDG